MPSCLAKRILSQWTGARPTRSWGARPQSCPSAGVCLGYGRLLSGGAWRRRETFNLSTPSPAFAATSPGCKQAGHRHVLKVPQAPAHQGAAAVRQQPHVAQAVRNSPADLALRSYGVHGDQGRAGQLE